MSSRRRIKRKLDQKQLIEKLRVKCPMCRKTSASSEEEAWQLARKQYARNGGEMPRRVYQCFENGPWHWTRMATPPSFKNLVDPPANELPIYREDYWS